MTDPNTQTDGDLLAAFADSGSESAFAVLVHRHGGMVHGVCRRILRDHHEAQDVTQAVFLALAHKARAMQDVRSVGGWLHIVAWRLAIKTRLSHQARKKREEQSMTSHDHAVPANQNSMLMQNELDAAIAELPDRYRKPLVLVHLEGQSLQQASDQLELNVNTTGTRLARARKLLRKKLLRRGIPVATLAALGELLSTEVAAVPLSPAFIGATAKAANMIVAGAGEVAVTTHVATLTKAGLKIVLFQQVKTVAVTASVCLVITGAALVGAHRYWRLASDIDPVATNDDGRPPGEVAGISLPDPPTLPDPVRHELRDVVRVSTAGIVSDPVDYLGLEMRVSLPKTMWSVGEPMEFTVHLRNNTEGTVRIRNPHNPRAWKITAGPWIMRFRDGYDRQLAGHKSLIVREVVAIERGDTLDIPLACSNAYFVAGAQADVPGEERDQLQPGAYAFQVGRIFMSTDDSAEAALPTGATTAFVSNPVNIEIITAK